VSGILMFFSRNYPFSRIPFMDLPSMIPGCEGLELQGKKALYGLRFAFSSIPLIEKPRKMLIFVSCGEYARLLLCL
jgi:hypothetical protein